MVHYNEILQNNKENYEAIDVSEESVSFGEIETEGRYNIELTSVELKETKKGDWKILWKGKCIDGEEAGKYMPTIFTGIQGADLIWTKKFLSRINALPENIMDIPEVIDGLKGLIVEVDIKINAKGFINCWINKLIDISAKEKKQKPKSLKIKGDEIEDSPLISDSIPF